MKFVYFLGKKRLFLQIIFWKKRSVRDDFVLSSIIINIIIIFIMNIIIVVFIIIIMIVNIWLFSMPSVCRFQSTSFFNVRVKIHNIYTFLRQFKYYKLCTIFNSTNFKRCYIIASYNNQQQHLKLVIK